MKAWQHALLGLILAVVLGVAAGLALRAYQRRQFITLTATVIDQRSAIVGQVDDPYGPPEPVVHTTLHVAYSVGGNAYTGQVQTGHARAFPKGTKIKILCSKEDPTCIELEQ